MNTGVVKYLCASGILLSLGGSLTSANPQDQNYQIVNKIFRECFRKTSPYSCLTGKVARAMDRAIDLDIPLFDGLVLKRNEEVVRNMTEARSATGFNQLRTALSRFLDTHTLTIDLSEGRGGSGGFGFGKFEKKEKKYLYYAMTAVLGIFGISTPLILKTLAILAGKALLASKAALIIVGSVALKKIFQNDKDASPVKVHTHTVPLDDHDRYYNTGGYPYVNQ